MMVNIPRESFMRNKAVRDLIMDKIVEEQPSIELAIELLVAWLSNDPDEEI